MCKNMKVYHHLTRYTKINSRWIKDLNISSDTIKVLEEIISRKISDIPCSKILIDTSPKARDIKERINKRDLIKIKSFCMAKENSIRENQDGGVGRHTAPPRTTRTDRESNSKGDQRQENRK